MYGGHEVCQFGCVSDYQSKDSALLCQKHRGTQEPSQNAERPVPDLVFQFRLSSPPHSSCSPRAALKMGPFFPQMQTVQAISVLNIYVLCPTTLSRVTVWYCTTSAVQHVYQRWDQQKAAFRWALVSTECFSLVLSLWTLYIFFCATF